MSSPDELKTRLSAALSGRDALIERLGPDTDAYRLVHSDADGFEGLTVDRLGTVLLVEAHMAGAAVDPLIAALKDRFGQMPLFLKHKRGETPEARTGIQVSGLSVSPEIVVQEAGLRYRLFLTGQIHTGLFLDSRAARRRVREISRDRRVLNLFSYTGGFGMAAAAGGARSTTNVDAKRSALAAAAENYKLNELPMDSRTFLKSDAVAFLKKCKKKGHTYDIIVLDPPPVSRRTNTDVLNTQTSFSRLVARSLDILSEGGVLAAGLNNRWVSDEAFDEMIDAGCRAAGRRPRRRMLVTADPDFPPLEARPTARFTFLYL